MVDSFVEALQKTRDRHVKSFVELDHAVVLFDEIDELVRERDMEKDAFGRFLTTSMLPKLAELWERRKIIYFVATNHINYFDSAIIRSHRFDALILVSPPSFEAKQDKLQELLPKEYCQFTFPPDVKEKVATAFQTVLSSAPRPRNGDDQNAAAVNEEYDCWREREIDRDLALAKFILLRHDELYELGYHLREALPSNPGDGKSISANTLKEALKGIADWQWRKNKSYADYERDQGSERRDYEMIKAWEVFAQPMKGPLEEIRSRNDRGWLTKAVDTLTDIEIEGCDLSTELPGSVLILPKVPAGGAEGSNPHPSEPNDNTP